MRLQGKTALITGGASGLGYAIAKEFALQGAAVVIADVDAAASERAAGEIAEHGAKPHVVALDVREPDQVTRAAKQSLDLLGSIDVLVNSAGVARIGPFLEMPVEDFDFVHNVNLRGTFLVGQAVARLMVGRGGSIINIASASGRRGSYGRAAYGTGKAAVIRLTEIMAVELTEHGIRVNGLAPGPIETPIVAALPKAGRGQWTSVVPMGRFGQPIEVAKAALFLACDDSSYMTGTTLDVDGGFAAGAILKG